MDEIGRPMSDLTEEVEAVISAIEPAFWSPASGPVDWNPERNKATTEQIRRVAETAIRALDAHRSSSGWRKSDNPIGEPVLVSASILEDAGDPVQPYVEFWYGNFVHRTYMPRALIHFPPSAKGMGDGG